MRLGILSVFVHHYPQSSVECFGIHGRQFIIVFNEEMNASNLLCPLGYHRHLQYSWLKMTSHSFDKNPTPINLPWTYTSNNTKICMCSVLHFSITCTCKIIEWKLPKHESIGNWFNKPWYIYNMEYYIAVKNKISMNLHSMTHRSTIKNII